MRKVSRTKIAKQLAVDELFMESERLWELGNLRGAHRLLLSGAKAGDSGCQLNLGYFYDVGLGVKRNRKAALQWYKRAVSKGCATAANNIGTIYRDENRRKKALSWFQRSVRMGNVDANLEIARLYLRDPASGIAAIPYLKRITNTKGDVTEASKEEAHRLLRELNRRSFPAIKRVPKSE